MRSSGSGEFAERLGELATLLVADEAGEVDVFKGEIGLERLGGVRLRAIGLEMQAGDEHARDPKENDVGPGDERAGGIEFRAGAVIGAHGFVGQSHEENQVSRVSGS